MSYELENKSCDRVLKDCLVAPFGAPAANTLFISSHLPLQQRGASENCLCSEANTTVVIVSMHVLKPFLKLFKSIKHLRAFRMIANSNLRIFLPICSNLISITNASIVSHVAFLKSTA